LYAEAAGILIAIVVIALMVRRGITLMWSLLAGAAIISLFSRLSLPEIYAIIIGTLISPVTAFLILMVMGISILGYVLEKTGTMQHIVSSMYQLITDARLLTTLLPAMVSLLSIPGGAIISAPMVSAAAKDLKLSNVQLALANVLFRHTFLLILPFSPSVIFIAGVTGLHIFQFIGFAFPVFLIMLPISFLLIFKDTPKSPSPPAENGYWQRISNLLKSLSPFFIIFLFYLGFDLYLPLSILIGILYTLFLYIPSDADRTSLLQERAKYVYAGINRPMVVTTFTILLFKGFIENTTAINTAVDAVLNRGVPLIILLLLIPYGVGLVIGNNVASLGVALPIFLPVLDGGSSQIAQLGLIYVSSYVGYLASPIHLCTYLTSEYFKAPLLQVIIKLNMVGILTLLVAYGISLFY
jgi:uncharacterized protein